MNKKKLHNKKKNWLLLDDTQCVDGASWNNERNANAYDEV